MDAGTRRSLIALAGLTALVATLVYRAGMLPAVVPASAPATEFSAERALLHGPHVSPGTHPSGSAAHAQVREYLVAQLRAMGLAPELQEATAVGTRYPTAGHVVNVLARIPGKTGQRKALLLAAHYDGVWASPAAGDDGLGVMSLLETVRALKAGPPLANDIIVLITDAEEAGLLGAAAFVREHPWAKDVEAMINVEARGTEGRVFMFETGTGNLDAVRVLKTVSDVTAGSLSVTIYRSLPNDTDLSEFSLLDKPALNFALADGVERYHTAHDDLAHLSKGSLQHAGNQVLALARAFGDGPLPRPVTGDAVFFDFPMLGVVAYPEGWSPAIALVAVLLALAVIVRALAVRDGAWKGVVLGAALPTVAAGTAGWLTLRAGAFATAMHASRQWDGAPPWRPEYAIALTLLALTITMASWAIGRRWASEASLIAGALVPWSLLALLTAMRLPGTSALTAWPLIAVALSHLVPARWADAARWIGAAAALAILVPLIYSVGGYLLPLDGPGGAAIGTLVPLVAWLCGPHLAALAGERRGRATLITLGVAVASYGVAMATVRKDSDHPSLSNITFYASAERDTAWLTMPALVAPKGSYGATVLGEGRRLLPAPTDTSFKGAWLYDAGMGNRTMGTPFARGDQAWPDAKVLADSSLVGIRRVTMRLTAPPGTLALRLSSTDAIRLVSIDGRTVDTKRYRRRPKALAIPLVAPPDSGFVVVLELPAMVHPAINLSAAAPGLATATGVAIPARPANEVPVQNGDITVRHRRVALP